MINNSKAAEFGIGSAAYGNMIFIHYTDCLKASFKTMVF